MSPIAEMKHERNTCREGVCWVRIHVGSFTKNFCMKAKGVIPYNKENVLESCLNRYSSSVLKPRYCLCN